ncbi:MalY/PatB family protein [Bacteroides sp. 224]|uniref:MalY/PatB family protein n=1 Tax=Bacteroides sp. 224 TaxID=2302936 RepID=UPI0013D0E921|nr:PatB family C-S lyase [Bacteroides sp. 224]NDV65965.1 putative C-S lyase [Bacteroides sp. 224]
MKYNFDEIIDRSHTDAVKVEALAERWGRTDLIPLWVADMDFRTAPFVVDAIKKRLENEILGYTIKSKDWYVSIINWLKERYDWKISANMLTYTPGIVTGLGLAIQCFTQPGDKVMVQPPVYHPFFLVTEHNHREVVWNPLILEDGQYRMDMENFRKQIKGCKLFILCNPHNPGGRVWTKEELEEVAHICYENNVLVVSDEIHADLTLAPYVHHPFANVSEEARNNSIVFMSPSKAFNMPGLSSSYCIIENEALRAKFQEYVAAAELDSGHLFAFITVAAAYSNGTEWLDQMLAYVSANIDYLESFLKEYTPKIKMIRPQASYLVFMDCRELGLSQPDLIKFFEDGAHLALNEGAMFGKEGAGFMRINVATPRSVLERALNQLREAYR